MRPGAKGCRASAHGMLVAAALWLAAFPASAEPPTDVATPAAGRYVTDGGHARLEVQTAPDGTTRFDLESDGANGHSCALRGEIRRGRAQLETTAGESACVLAFEPIPGGFRVSSSSGNACRFFCGARAGFELDYLRLPAVCAPSQVQQQRQRFQQHYAAKRYREAAPVLQTLLKDCERFLFWLDADRIRNDLAITQYHLGQKAACRATLAPVAERATRNRQTLQASLPPADFESYLPIAQATWHNLRLCRR